MGSPPRPRGPEISNKPRKGALYETSQYRFSSRSTGSALSFSVPAEASRLMAMAMPAQSLEIGKPHVTMANRPAHHSRVTCAARCTAHCVQARRAR